MTFTAKTIVLDACTNRSGEGVSISTRAGCRLLIVDDELTQRNVLTLMLGDSGIVCTAVSSAVKALDLLQRQPMDAIIADLNMPGISGMKLLMEIRAHFPNMVFLMATGAEDVRLGVEAMRQGADDYLIKPLQTDVVMASLDRAFLKKSLEQELEKHRNNLETMVRERTEQLESALVRIEENYVDTLDALGAAIDLRDEQTAGHSRRVALCSINMLMAMHGTPGQLKNLVMGAWLHDIGKLAIPDAILLKPGPLTAEEREIIRGHAQIGYELVRRIPFLTEAAELVLAHHERWDGSGYPRGLKGTDIPLSARIFAVADTLDAMTSDRPYRKALPFQQARDEIERMSGTQFDPRVVSTFLSFPTETWEALREQTHANQISATLANLAAENPFRFPGSGGSQTVDVTSKIR